MGQEFSGVSGEHLLLDMPPLGDTETLNEMHATLSYVFLVAADVHLRALGKHLAFGIHPLVHAGLPTAVADGLHLLQCVRPGQKVHAALERFALEVGAQAIAEHRDLELVGDAAKLLHLVLPQKLGFVYEDACALSLALPRRHAGRPLLLHPHEIEEIEARVELDGRL